VTLPVALVVPTLNEAASLPLLFESVAEQTRPFAEVVVADGGSTDGSCSLAAGAGAQVVEAPRGRGEQIAAGIGVSTAPVVLVVHADSRCHSRTVEAIQEHFDRRPDSPGGCLGHRFERRDWLLRLVEWGDRRRARRGASYGDQGQFFRRDALECVGGFPVLPLMEDVELSQRLRRIGEPAYLDVPLVCSTRGFERLGVVGTILRNLRLRRAYRKRGPEAAYDLYQRYYVGLNAATRSNTS
jgi:rSAM/selenodomain-associated transferase 2